MAHPILDTETADADLASGATVLTHTPSASVAKRCQAIVLMGDGDKDLDGSGGDFSVTITVGGNTWDGGAQTKTLGTAVRPMLQSVEFWVPAGAEVTIAVTSPNAADSDVGVTATLYDVTPIDAEAILDAAEIRAALGMAEADLDEQLNVLAASTGSGANAVTITVDDGTDPIVGATVRVSEVGGAETFSGTTDADGEVVFSLDPADYLVSITKPMYSFAPEEITVDGTEAVTLSMTAAAAAPADPDLATLVFTCVDETGAAEAAVRVKARLITPPAAGTGVAYDRGWQSAVSGADGVATLTVVQGAVYEIVRGSGQAVEVTIPAEAVTAVESITGQDD